MRGGASGSSRVPSVPVLALALAAAAHAPGAAAGPGAGGLPFAAWLVEEGEPYHAVTEVLRMAHEATDHLAESEARLVAARIMLRAGEPLAAAEAYARALAVSPGPPGVMLEMAAAELQVGQLGRAVGSLAEVRRRAPPGDTQLGAHLALLECELGLRAGRYDVAMPALEQAALFLETSGSAQARGAVARALAIADEGLPHRAPWAALALSALIPGAGQLYAGQAFDAVVSFLATGTAGLLALDAYDGARSIRGQRAGFYLTVALAASIYGWNVYSASGRADHFNMVEDQRLRRRILAELPPAAGP